MNARLESRHPVASYIKQERVYKLNQYLAPPRTTPNDQRHQKNNKRTTNKN